MTLIGKGSNQRNDPQRERSALSCATTLIEELARAEIPEDAAPAFLTWIFDRVYRLAKRDAHGVRVPFDQPAGYYLTTARSMIHKAIKARWACEDLNDREWQADRLRPEVARWKADEQARHDAEWAQRESPIAEVHEAALRDAGFREVGVIWRTLDDGILLAVH